LLGKALGGGMPLGAFVSDKKIMDSFTNNPVLGHINTFGGHPVSCAAGLAAFKALIEENIIAEVNKKQELFTSLLKHNLINKVSVRGLMIAVAFDSFETNKKIIDQLIEMGVFTDWFLFASNCLRIAPPLNISEDEIETSCRIILQVLDSVS
jgi:acetylornithine/succinyldiaminopimelate/putrescine aminotransferase